MSFDWRTAGHLGLDEQRLIVFPRVGAVPGVYRFVIDHPMHGRAVYIGEAADLDRRWRSYRLPGAGQNTNQRVAPVLADCIHAGGPVRVDIATAVSIWIERTPWTGDLTVRSTRLLAENAAITEARTSGARLLNR
jgi:hypothetical protein